MSKAVEGGDPVEGFEDLQVDSQDDEQDDECAPETLDGDTDMDIDQAVGTQINADGQQPTVTSAVSEPTTYVPTPILQHIRLLLTFNICSTTAVQVATTNEVPVGTKSVLYVITSFQRSFRIALTISRPHRYLFITLLLCHSICQLTIH